MYMPGAITPVTKTAVNNNEKSHESSAPGWVSKKTTEAMKPTTATGTISRHRRRVARDTVVTTTAPDTAVEKDPRTLTTKATTSGFCRLQRIRTTPTTPSRRSMPQSSADLPGVRVDIAGHPEAGADDDGEQVAPRRLPAGQRRWGRGLGGVHLAQGTGGGRPWAATAGQPTPYRGLCRHIPWLREVARRPMCGRAPHDRLDTMITVEELSKRYGAHLSVDCVSFRAQPGSVTGFLGPNGAGKSTTMRMMTGLTPPSSGRSTILGVPYAQLRNPGRHVGVLLDASAQHNGRTGREVLRLGATVMGLPRRRVDEMLEIVGLSGTEGDRRVGNYSLGMRQRLGIAHALLGDPQVLILDEPANGLDPAGIHWMRGLLKGFADRGGTVLLSSHLLHEIEVIADHLVVIGRGVIVADGSKADLLTAAGTLVRGLQPEALARCLDAAGFTYQSLPDGAYVVEATGEQIATVAAQYGVVVTELRGADGAGLEDMFLQLTSEDAREKVTA